MILPQELLASAHCWNEAFAYTRRGCDLNTVDCHVCARMSTSSGGSAVGNGEMPFVGSHSWSRARKTTPYKCRGKLQGRWNAWWRMVMRRRGLPVPGTHETCCCCSCTASLSSLLRCAPWFARRHLHAIVCHNSGRDLVMYSAEGDLQL